MGRVWIGSAATLGLTGFAVAVSGYHPFVEDGGVYAAGVRRLLDPTVYPAWTEFVTEHLRFSAFAPMVAALTRGTHMPLEWVLLVLFVATAWATLAAGWMVVCRVTTRLDARLGAVALLACWLTLPIAGTSLYLMDPYLTARSFTTPLVLLALAWALDAGWLRCGLALSAAALLHPLMAGYGVGAVVMVVAMRRRRIVGWLALTAAALAMAAVVEWRAPAESAAYLRVAMTRYYWFPAQWRWFELVGLAAPVGMLVWLERTSRNETWRRLARITAMYGVAALAVAAVFCRETRATHLVARLQPLRAFQLVYEVMILLLGAWLGERVLQRHRWRWALMLAVLGSAMLWAQRETFPNSSHMEWPGAEPVNPWQQAFVWVRWNTPKDALFALDARYITEGRHEDAQCFRAIAERSALPDYSKDGGEAAITPSLTGAWVRGVEAQTGLETESDAERLHKLRPYGVGWMVLETGSRTGWACPYANATVKVCRVP
jgi:hypothetical protein